MFQYLNNSGIVLTGSVVLIFVLAGIIYKKYSRKEFVIFTALMLFLVPFLLPQMHERYFFPAGIGSLLLAFIYPSYLWVAVAMQAITIFAYSPFLFGQTLLPMSIIAIFVAAVTSAVAWLYFKTSDNDKPVRKTSKA